MSMTWEEALAYADSVLDDECAKAGVTVEITDPRIIADTVRILRSGKRRYEEQLRREAESRELPE